MSDRSIASAGAANDPVAARSSTRHWPDGLGLSQTGSTSPSPKSSEPIAPRLLAVLVAISSDALCSVAALSSHGSPGGQSAIAGRRSATMTTRGDSSAKRSRTMNASSLRAAERRADAAQSMPRIASPRRYGRDPATSDPGPRRELGVAPNASPT